jgi:hypothetical protein
MFCLGVPIGFGGVLMWKAATMDHTFEGTSTAALANRLADKFHIDVTSANFIVRDVAMGTKYSFLVDAYRPDCLAWESVDMLRKVAMVGFVVFLGQGTFEQMVGAAGLSCAYLALHVKIWPFKVGRDNLFRMLTEIQCECLPLSFRVLC